MILLAGRFTRLAFVISYILMISFLRLICYAIVLHVSFACAELLYGMEHDKFFGKKQDDWLSLHLLKSLDNGFTCDLIDPTLLAQVQPFSEPLFELSEGDCLFLSVSDANELSSLMDTIWRHKFIITRHLRCDIKNIDSSNVFIVFDERDVSACYKALSVNIFGSCKVVLCPVRMKAYVLFGNKKEFCSVFFERIYSNEAISILPDNYFGAANRWIVKRGITLCDYLLAWIANNGYNIFEYDFGKFGMDTYSIYFNNINANPFDVHKNFNLLHEVLNTGATLVYNVQELIYLSKLRPLRLLNFCIFLEGNLVPDISQLPGVTSFEADCLKKMMENVIAPFPGEMLLLMISKSQQSMLRALDAARMIYQCFLVVYLMTLDDVADDYKEHEAFEQDCDSFMFCY